MARIFDGDAPEPDTLDDALAVIADLHKAGAGLYGEIKRVRASRKEAEKKAAWAQRELQKAPQYKRERDEAIQLAQKAYSQLESITGPAEPKPTLPEQRLEAAAGVLANGITDQPAVLAAGQENP